MQIRPFVADDTGEISPFLPESWAGALNFVLPRSVWISSRLRCVELSRVFVMDFCRIPREGSRCGRLPNQTSWNSRKSELGHSSRDAALRRRRRTECDVQVPRARRNHWGRQPLHLQGCDDRRSHGWSARRALRGEISEIVFWWAFLRASVHTFDRTVVRGHTLT